MREIKFRVWDIQFKRMKLTGIGINKGVVDGEDVVIMQYTGLKDKNSKEIYEGDVVKRGDKCGEIYWSDAFHGWRVDSFYGERQPDKSLALFPNMEIIGNIYENPELSKG